MSQSMPRLARALPWLALGPITGLLAAGVYRNWRAGEFTLASLYLIAMGGYLFDLGLLVEKAALAG